MQDVHPNFVAYMRRKHGQEWCPEEARKRRKEVEAKQRAALLQRPRTDRLRRKFNQKRYQLLRGVLERGDAYACKLCGTAKDLHLDHIIPLSKGGTNDLDNIQLLCSFHNVSKGSST